MSLVTKNHRGEYSIDFKETHKELGSGFEKDSIKQQVHRAVWYGLVLCESFGTQQQGELP